MSRRKTPAGQIPDELRAWFAGEPGADGAWWPLLRNREPELARWWAQWLATHPQAMPPAGAPWIQWGTA